MDTNSSATTSNDNGASPSSPDVPSRDEILRAGTVRTDLMNGHPVTEDKAAVVTPPVNAAWNMIRNILWQRHPGCAFYANPQTGKSTAIKLLMKAIPSVFEDVVVFKIISKKRDSVTEKAFFTDILRGLKHAAPEVGTASIKRERILNLICAHIVDKGAKRVVLFVDEAQTMEEAHVTWLRDIMNDLAELDYKSTVFMFGQYELKDLRSALISMNRRDVVVRFMAREFEFSGLANAADLAVITNAFDNPMTLDFPRGSGISYSEFFLPKAYAAGWRLENETPKIWAALDATLVRKDQSIGMRWVMGTIRSFLLEQSLIDNAHFVSNRDQWSEAVLNSGLNEDQVAAYEPELKDIGTKKRAKK